MYAVLVAKNFVHEESSSVRECIAQDVLQLASFVMLHTYDAVLGVNAGIGGLDGSVYLRSPDVAPDDVVTHVKGDDLFEVEHVLHHHDTAALVGILLFVELSFFVFVVEMAGADAYAELFIALRALEHQLLPLCVLAFIEDNVLVALWASDSFHGNFIV